jgi:DNA processing protein
MSATDHAAALAGLPSLGPGRLRRLLHRYEPDEAWAMVLAGAACRPPLPKPRADDPPDLGARLAHEAQSVDPAEVGERCRALGVAVHLLGRPGSGTSPAYPARLAVDVDPPPVLFSLGEPAAASARPAVTIVGTRNATAAGLDLARELGHALAGAGVAVVSGLALGIDGAAHQGALAAQATGPVGVVACGLDRPYPARHRALWAAVARAGVLLAEVPPGTEPQAFRFPRRNRILAALADVVVVVESRRAGGSLLTVREAERRGVCVLAVPGSPRNPAAAGTNLLIQQGCHPVLDPTDVLVALGLATEGEQRPSAPHGRGEPDDPAGLLDLLAEPATLDDLVARTGRSLAEIALAVGRLEEGGWVQRHAHWFERVRRPR